MRALHTITAVAALLFALTPLCSEASAASATKRPPKREMRKGGVKNENGIETKTASPSAYRKLFKGKQHVAATGMITLHKADSDVYLEIPNGMLERRMLLGASVLNTSDLSESSEGVVPVKPRAVAFRKVDSLIQIVGLDRRQWSVSPETKVASAIEKAARPVVLAVFPIAAVSPDGSSVVKATGFFLNGNDYFSPKDPGGYNSLGGIVSRSYKFLDRSSFVKNVVAYEDNVSVITEMTYNVTGKALGLLTVNPERPVTSTMRITLLLAADEPAPVRLADSRVGTERTVVYEYSGSEQGATAKWLAERWRLEPSDAEAWARGESVEPAVPITFYIDQNFPESWKKHIAEGVLSWNDSFEKIGFRNAVRVEEESGGSQTDNITRSSIRYIATPDQSIRSSVWTDDRSGEIISANIYISHDIVERIQADRLFQTGAADVRTRSIDLPEELFGESLSALVTHHVGRCLGLSVNLAGTASVPTDSLHSANYTQAHGISSSIMDIVPLNYVATQGDVERGVKLCQTAPAIYDDYVIKWLYEPVSLKTERPEEEVLSEMVDACINEPAFRYGRAESRRYAYDPRSVEGDLGDNPLSSAEQAIGNLSEVVQNLPLWIGDEDDDYSYRRQADRYVYDKLTDYIKPVLLNIGGIYLNERYSGDDTPAVVPLPAERQKESLLWMLNLIDRLDWIGSRHETADGIFNSNSGIYVRNAVFKQLLSQIERMSLGEVMDEDSYTKEQAYREVKAHLFDKKRGKAVTDWQMINNKAFVDKVTGKAGLTVGKPVRTAQTGSSINSSDVTAAAATEAMTPVSGIYFNVPPEERHLMFGLLQEIRKSLIECSSNAPDFTSRNHYEYLIHNIDSAMKL